MTAFTFQKQLDRQSKYERCTLTEWQINRWTNHCEQIELNSLDLLRTGLNSNPPPGPHGLTQGARLSVIRHIRRRSPQRCFSFALARRQTDFSLFFSWRPNPALGRHSGDWNYQGEGGVHVLIDSESELLNVSVDRPQFANPSKWWRGLPTFFPMKQVKLMTENIWSMPPLFSNSEYDSEGAVGSHCRQSALIDARWQCHRVRRKGHVK